jgi:hypothetical protein
MPDHIHLCVSIPPKYSVAQTIGLLKGKSASEVMSCLTEAAWAASRTKNTYLKARYHRLAARRDKKRAIVAVGHTILIMAYHIIKEQSTYKELGADYFDRLNEQAIIRRLTSRIEILGYQVDLTKTEAVA